MAARLLTLAAQALRRLAANPAVRGAATSAAQKARAAFSRSKERAKELCEKVVKAVRRSPEKWTKDKKIADQMKKRGWDDDLVDETLKSGRRVKTTDARFKPDGSGLRNNEPATAYVRKDGSYVVRNDRSGEIVQVSNRNDPGWKNPF